MVSLGIDENGVSLINRTGQKKSLDGTKHYCWRSFYQLLENLYRFDYHFFLAPCPKYPIIPYTLANTRIGYR